MRAARYVALTCVVLGATMCGGKEKGGDTSGAGTGSGHVGSGPTSGGVTSTSGVGGSVSTTSTGSVVVGSGGTVPTTPDPVGVGGGEFGAGGAAGIGGVVGSGGGMPGAGGTGTAGGVTYCIPPYAAPATVGTSLISDFEGDVAAPPLGFIPRDAWAMDRDGTGTTSMALEPCGTSGTGLHAKASGTTRWGADVAAAFVSQLRPVDASRFGGMSFVIRSAAPTSMIFKLQNPYSQPACGKCYELAAGVGEECFSGYTKTVAISSDNAPVVVRFQDLSQQMWGYRPPGTAAIDVRNLVSIVFAFDGGIDFDVCIDDVKFVP